MKKLSNILILFSVVFSSCIFSKTLQSGDVLLISFNCYECRVIESETESNFSHSGVIIKNEKNELNVGQSLGQVALYPIKEFLKNKTPNSKVAIYRPVELSQKLTPSYEKEMLKVFKNKYQGLKFDSRYLWDNYDSSGKELLYCSEFIAKYLDNFLTEQTIPYPLSYKKNYEYWLKYFRGDVPEGVLGNSPASISKDPRFKFIGHLENESL